MIWKKEFWIRRFPRRRKKQQRDENQMDIFVSAVPRPHRAIEELKKIDVNEITPLEALKKIDEWQKEL